MWPENMAAAALAVRLRTQWHVDAWGAPTAMRYDSLALMLRIEQVPRADWPQAVDGLQVIEVELLRLMREAMARSKPQSR